MESARELRALDYVHAKSIGGSDVAGILGVSQYKTPAQIWDRINGTAEPQEERAVTIRGRLLERRIRDLYQFVTGRHVEPGDRWFHPEYPFLHYTPDGIIQEYADRSSFGVLEIKALGTWTFKQTVNLGVDPEYLAQLQHGMFVGQKSWGSFALFNSDFAWILFLPEEMWGESYIREVIDGALLWFDVTPSDHWATVAVPALVAWWHEYVETGIRPPMTYLDQPTFVPARVGGEAQDWRDNAEFNRAIEALKVARENFDIAEHAKTLAENTIKQMMGEHEVVVGRGCKVTWKEGTRKNFNHKRLLQDHPEFDSYYETSTTRTFRPSFER